MIFRIIIKFLSKHASISKYWLFTVVFRQKIESWKPDIIHAHDLLTLPLAIKVAKKINAKVIYDAHELETHRNPPAPFFIRKFVKYIEKRNIRKADEVFTVCEPIAEYLKDNYSIKKPHIVLNSPLYPLPDYKALSADKNGSLMGGAQNSENQTEEKFTKLRSSELLKNATIGIYVGLITFNRGLETVIKALSFIPSIYIFAIGPRNEKVAIKLNALAKCLGVDDRFIMLDPVPHHLVVDFIKDADFGISPIWPITLSYDWAMPNKLFEMSFAGLPIIASNTEEISKFVVKNKLGLIYHYDDPIDLAKKITLLLNSYEKYKPSEESIIKLQKKYNWNAQTKSISKVYKDLLSE